MGTNIEDIRRDVSLVDTALSFGVDLQKNGREYEACCCFHAENTPSLTFFPGRDGVGRFHCFGCDAKGDVIDFVKGIKGCDTREAIEILGGRASRPNIQPRRIRAPVDIYAGITMLAPPHALEVGKAIRLYNPKRAGSPEEWGNFKPSMVFPYSNGGYVLRRDIQGDGKETPMVAYVRLPDGCETWSRFPFPKPRPLYLVDRLEPGQVIVVEGEKCADAMRKFGRQGVSWAGGTNGIEHADWSPLAGRKVVVWPDADGPGVKTAGKIADTLLGLGCAVKVMAVS